MMINDDLEGLSPRLPPTILHLFGESLHLVDPDMSRSRVVEQQHEALNIFVPELMSRSWAWTFQSMPR